MSTKIILTFLLLAVFGGTWAANVANNSEQISYNTVKLQHADLAKEIKEMDRKITKNDAIKCYGTFGKMVSGFLNIFPFANYFQDLLFPDERQCERDKQDHHNKLIEKKKLRELRTVKLHETMKTLHPMQKKDSNKSN